MGRTTGLTDQQRAFCDEYPKDFNATQAAVRAGYSPHTADRQGSRLLKNAEVASVIAIAKAERSARVGVNADIIVQELTRIARLDPRSLMSWGPEGLRLRESSELSADDAAAVAEVTTKVVRTTITFGEGEDAGVMTREDTIAISVKLHDKLKAIELLMKHLGMNAPIKVDLNDELRKAAEAEGLDAEEMVRIAAQIAASVS